MGFWRWFFCNYSKSCNITCDVEEEKTFLVNVTMLGDIIATSSCNVKVFPKNTTPSLKVRVKPLLVIPPSPVTIFADWYDKDGDSVKCLLDQNSDGITDAVIINHYSFQVTLPGTQTSYVECNDGYGGKVTEVVPIVSAFELSREEFIFPDMTSGRTFISCGNIFGIHVVEYDKNVGVEKLKFLPTSSFLRIDYDGKTLHYVFTEPRYDPTVIDRRENMYLTVILSLKQRNFRIR